jgi:hypothetical protein
MRGWCDSLVGGIGLRPGRRDPEELRVGGAVDFWRVKAVEINRRLRLVAEMKLPGRAWLEYTLEPHGGRTRITQHAIFDPVCLAGLAYWYTVYFFIGSFLAACSALSAERLNSSLSDSACRQLHFCLTDSSLHDFRNSAASDARS